MRKSHSRRHNYLRAGAPNPYISPNEVAPNPHISPNEVAPNPYISPNEVAPNPYINPNYPLIRAEQELEAPNPYTTNYQLMRPKTNTNPDLQM